MLSFQRQQNILGYIEERGTVTVKELGKTFDISLATVRRDLDLLEEQGKVRRVHGGAVYVESVPDTEPPVLHREKQQFEEKDRIGKKAAELVKNGDTIIIASGTTTEAMVPYLADKKNLTVITNAINIVYMLARYPDISVIVPGGWLRHSEFSLLGHLAEYALRELNADKIFHGAFGVNAEQGLTGSFLQETEIDKALISVARELIILADHTKFQQAGPITFASLDSTSILITDNEAPVDQLKKIEALGVSIICV